MKISFASIPLLVLPVGIYNLLAVIMMFAANEVDGPSGFIGQVVINIPMIASHAVWKLSIGNLVLIFALCCLFFEIIGASRSNNTTILNHVLSMGLFVICLIEFLLIQPFGTSAFFPLRS